MAPLTPHLNAHVAVAQRNHPESDFVIIGDDGLARCGWAAATPLEQHYHDTEWGTPITGEHDLFERLCLEAFQAGLSWRTVLERRDALRQTFCDFDVDAAAELTDNQLETALLDRSIIRNRAKVFAVRSNARATVALRAAGGLHELVWSFRPAQHRVPHNREDLIATTAESAALAKALKKAGFRFVGPTSAYALMQAGGLVNDHMELCHRRVICDELAGSTGPS